jgi:hypothetical protein
MGRGKEWRWDGGKNEDGTGERMKMGRGNFKNEYKLDFKYEIGI